MVPVVVSIVLRLSTLDDATRRYLFWRWTNQKHIISVKSAKMSSKMSSNQPPAVDMINTAIPVWTTHEVIRLTSEQASITVVIERRPDPKRVIIAMAREIAPYDRLKVETTKGGILSFDGGSHKDSTWTISPTIPLSANGSGVADGRYVLLRSNARMNGGGAPKCVKNANDESCYWWLGGREGSLCSVEGKVNQPPIDSISECTWKVESVPSLFEQLHSDVHVETLSKINLNETIPLQKSDIEMTEKTRELSDDEISTFIEDGYVLRPSLAPMPLVCAALSLINSRLGYGNKVICFLKLKCNCKFAKTYLTPHISKLFIVLRRRMN